MKKLILKKKAEKMLGFPIHFSDGELLIEELEKTMFDPDRVYVYIWLNEPMERLSALALAKATWDDCLEKHVVTDILYEIRTDADLTVCVPVDVLVIPGSEREIVSEDGKQFLYVNLCMD